jgi:hypothetical protein
MTKTYLRQPKLARRWDMSVRNLQLLRQKGLVPAPDMYMGQNPMWSDQTIEEFERASVKRAAATSQPSPAPESEKQEHRTNPA